MSAEASEALGLVVYILLLVGVFALGAAFEGRRWRRMHAQPLPQRASDWFPPMTREPPPMPPVKPPKPEPPPGRDYWGH